MWSIRSVFGLLVATTEVGKLSGNARFGCAHDTRYR